MAKNSNFSVIVGLGKTGLSVARHMLRNDQHFLVMDTRSQPPEMAALKQLSQKVKILTGGLDEQLLTESHEIILSPGIPLTHPAISKAVRSGVPVISDVEVFARALNAGQKVVAITGTNGKSTVSCLLSDMAGSCGWKVALGGNIGTPVLDLLDTTEPELFVLELSSFQLETTYSLQVTVAVILNVTADHLDRHYDLKTYAGAKARILRDCAAAVIGRDCLEQFVPQLPAKIVTFGKDAPENEHFGLLGSGGDQEIYRGKTRLIAENEITGLPGTDGLQNAQAALAAGMAIGLPDKGMFEALGNFRSLPHRYRTIGTLRGVDWIDDSKATNVAAAVAALQRTNGHCIWIAGGLAKGTDFTPLAAAAKKWVRCALLIGRDASQMAKAISNMTAVRMCDDLAAAARHAVQLAQPGDCVLLAPACASLDMFENYAHRGRCFAEAFASVRQEYFTQNENDAA